MLQLEAPLATALKLRGNRVHAVICDGVFSACVKREITDQVPMSEWKKSCGACKRECEKVLENMHIPYSYIGDYVTAEDLSSLRRASKAVSWENLEEVQYGGVSIGKNVRSAILRFMKGYDSPIDQSLVREYAFSGLICAAATQVAIDRLRPARIFMSHGTYVDWGPALHTALARKIPVIAWIATYLPACFYFRHVEDGVRIDFHNMSNIAWNGISAGAFTENQRESLEQYLQDRYKKDTSFDMKYFKKYTGKADELRKKYQFDSSKPLWGIMTHINWDTVSDFSPMLYSSFDEWVIDTIHTIKNIGDVQWVIKIHPAEAWANPESGIESLIKKHFPELTENIRVLSADENISPLDFFNMVDGGVTVYGTSGLELALHGKPIILAGEAHYGNKGFTHDAVSQEHYRELLKRACNLPELNDEQKELVRKYAYCYFIQRQIPISVVKDPESKWWNFQFDKKELLLEGRDPVIDFVCEKIIDGTDFIMDEQLLRLAEENMSGQTRC